MEDIDKMTQTERDKQSIHDAETWPLKELIKRDNHHVIVSLWPKLIQAAQRGIQYREAVERFLAKGEEGGGADGLYEAAFQLSDEIDAIKEVSE